MSARVTMSDVRSAFEGLCLAAESAGLAPADRIARWNVEQGSATYGRAYRLYQLGADTLESAPDYASEEFPYGSGHYASAGLNDYLGMTAAEAKNTLRAYTNALWAVVNAHKTSEHR